MLKKTWVDPKDFQIGMYVTTFWKNLDGTKREEESLDSSVYKILDLDWDDVLVEYIEIPWYKMAFKRNRLVSIKKPNIFEKFLNLFGDEC